MQALASLPSAIKLLIPIAITVWMVAVAVMDHRTGRIPNTWTAPVLLVVGTVRLVEGLTGNLARVGMVVAWAAIFLLWMLHFIGGGDAKFLMAEVALFPTMEFIALLALILLVITLPLLLLEMKGREVAAVRQSLRDRLLMGLFLPTEEELQQRGRRYAWTFAIPGIIFTWVYWRELGPWFG